MSRLLAPALLTLATLLAAPFASAGAMEADTPGANGCGMFPVTWDYCDTLVCVHVWWYEHNQDESVCVPNQVQCWLFCVPCWTGLCGAPATASCAEVYLPAYRCEEDVACVQVGHEPSVPTRRACVPDLHP